MDSFFRREKTGMTNKFLMALLSVGLLAACSNETPEEPSEDQVEDSQIDQEETIDDEEVSEGDTSEEADQEDPADSDLTPDQSQVSLTDADINTDINQIHQLIRNHDERYNFNYDYIRLDQEDGTFFYEVKTWDGAYHLIYHINPELNDIVLDTEENNIDALGSIDIFNVLQPSEAVQVALDNSDAKEAYRWILSMDQELDQPVYQVELETGVVSVNALDGSPLGVE